MQTLYDAAVINDFLQLIAQLLIIYCCIFLFRTRARVNTRTRATSNLCEHAGEARPSQFYMVKRPRCLRCRYH